MRTDFRTMIFEKKDFDIVIGKPFTDVTTVRYIFDGWTGEEEGKKYNSSLGIFEEENAAGRVTPHSPVARTIVRIIEWDYVSGGTRRKDGSKTGDFDLTYWNENGSPEDIEEYFRSHGIALHRATPFIKPQKDFWLAWKERFSNKVY